MTVPDDGRRPAALSRRGFLCLAAGTTAAAALGCAPRRPPGGPAIDVRAAGIEGEIVGASRRLGHRLRTGDLPPPSAEREVGVVVAGGGIAGLSAAWKLARSGVDDFLVLELESTPGGNARWGQNEASAFPWGAHYLPVPTRESRATRELVKEMDLVESIGEDGEPVYDVRHLCHAPQERLFRGGEWWEGLSARDVTGPEDRASLEAFEARVRHFRAFRDARGRPAFALPVAFSSDAPELLELDRVSMRQDLDRAGIASERLRWYVDYCCRDDYGSTLDTTSAWAGWHYFCARDEVAPYLTWPEGNGRIVRHLVERAGAERVLGGRLVHRIRPGAAGGADVLAFDAATGRTTLYRARRVICALPRFVVPYVVEGYPHEGAADFAYSPWVVANLTVRRPPDGAAWDNVLYDSRSLGYVVATHQDLRIAPRPSVLTWYLPFTGPDPAAERRLLEERSWEEWASIVLADLSGAHPEIVELTTRVDVMLWGHAMIRPLPGFVTGASRRRALEPFGPVRFAHSDMSGLSLFEEAQYRGVKAAEEVMAELGHGFESSLGDFVEGLG